MQHRVLRHRDAARGRAEILAGEMQEHRAAAVGGARRGVVVDLDDEVVEMILARQTVACLIALKPDRPIIMTIGGVFAPGVLVANRADREKSVRPRMTVSPPPEFSRAICAARRPAVALALVGENAAAAKRNRNG